MNRQVIINSGLYFVCLIPMIFLENLFNFLSLGKSEAKLEDGTVAPDTDEFGMTNI